MKNIVLFLIILSFINCSKKDTVIKDSDYLIKNNTWIRNFNENYYSIGKNNNGIIFMERIFKYNKKKYSIFLIQFTKRKKNEIYDKYKLRVDDINGNVIYDTIIDSGSLYANIFFNEDNYYYYQKKTNLNFAINKSISADGKNFAYHIIEFDSVTNKFFYKELYNYKE